MLDLIPQDELKATPHFNFAPMIDFLFLMLALFATLAVSRAALYDSEVQLVQLKPDAGAHNVRGSEVYQINLTITATGQFKWLTEFQEYPMENLQAIQAELIRQYHIGALPQDKEKTQILLHIDQNTPWGVIARTLFAIREIGFTARPVHEEGTGN